MSIEYLWNNYLIAKRVAFAYLIWLNDFTGCHAELNRLRQPFYFSFIGLLLDIIRITIWFSILQMIFLDTKNIRNQSATARILCTPSFNLNMINDGIPRHTTIVKSWRSSVMAQYFHFRPAGSLSLTITVYVSFSIDSFHIVSSQSRKSLQLIGSPPQGGLFQNFAWPFPNHWQTRFRHNRDNTWSQDHQYELWRRL